MESNQLPSQGDGQDSLPPSSLSSLSSAAKASAGEASSTAQSQLRHVSTLAPDMLMDEAVHGPRPPPTMRDHVAAVVAYIRSQAQVIESRWMDIAVLAAVFTHLALVVAGLVLLAHDPYRTKHPGLFGLLPIIVMVSLILTHLFLMEIVVRFIAFGVNYYKRDAWNIVDVVLVTLLVLSQWFLRLPECIIASVLVGGRLWRLMRLTDVCDVKQGNFANDTERLVYLGTNIKHEHDRNWRLTDTRVDLKRARYQLKCTLEVTVNAALKAKK